MTGILPEDETEKRTAEKTNADDYFVQVTERKQADGDRECNPQEGWKATCA